MKKCAIGIAAVLASTLAAPAIAQSSGDGIERSNFSYSTLGFELGKATPDEDIIFLNERYEDFGAASLFGSFQAASNLAFLVSASGIANDGPQTELSQTNLTFQLLAPLPVGDQVDIIPRFGFGTFEAEACFNGLCESEDDSAAVYGVSLRAWAAPGLLEFSAGIEDSTLEDSDAALAIGAALWAADHHRFALDYEGSDSFTVVTIGYSYNW